MKHSVRFLLNNPSSVPEGFTIIEQHYGCRGDSQMVLIKLRDDSYMLHCRLTLLEAYGLALIPLSSGPFFYVQDTYVYGYF